MNYSQWLSQACNELSTSESSKRDAEILLGFVTKKSRTYILAFSETVLTLSEEIYLQQLLAKRKQGEPIAYLVGEREFWSLPLTVSSATLIPRPDTECLVEQALKRLPAIPSTILDLGTGTGAIALALATERRDCSVVGVDLLSEVVAIAQHNAEKLAVANVHFEQSDWFSALSGRDFSMIVSNPPYIDCDDPHLKQGDVRFEPASALTAADHGLADLIHIITTSWDYLSSYGWLLVEHGWQQGQTVRQLFYQRGYQQVETIHDYGKNERVTVGFRL